MENVREILPIESIDVPETVPEPLPKGIHTVQKQLKSGILRTYHYAWRGGPPIDGRDTEELVRAYWRARNVRPRKRLRRPIQNTEMARERVCKKALLNARQRASKRGIVFDLTADALLQMAKRQEWRCALSDLPFDMTFDSLGQHAYNPFGVSIDRIEPAKGYTVGNVRLVLTAVNFGLNDWGAEIYLRIAKAVVAKTLAAEALSNQLRKIP